MNLTDLLSAIDKQRNIKPSTLKAYGNNIKKLTKDITGKEYSSINYLKDFKKIKDFLNKKTISTRKNYIATILVMLRAVNKDDKLDKLIDKYSEYLMDVNSEYEDKIKNQDKDQKTSDNWMDLKELRKTALKYYTKKIRDKGINKKTKTKLSKKEYKILQAYLLVCLYLLSPDLPPRRNEYAEMKIIKSNDYAKLSDEEKEKYNFLWIKSRNNKKFIYNNQKNNKKTEVNIPSAVNSVINLYLKYHNNENFLINARGEQMKSNSLTKLLHKIFEKATGKHISSTMLRKIYVSHKFDLPKLKELEETNKKMGHTSTTMMKNYYKSDNEEKKSK